MKISYIFIFLLYYHFSFAQFREAFSDGEFRTSPSWQGDTAYFIVNQAGELQSHGPATNAVISLSTPSKVIRNTIWEFYVKIECELSSSNYAKIYLASDQSDLKGPLQGYFLKIGGESGSLDGIDLYKQTGSQSTQLIDGVAGHAGKSINQLRIKVSCDDEGNWELLSDTSGGYNFLPEGKSTDNSINQSSWFGLSCIHSSTRKDLFYFDDIIIQPAPLTIKKIIAFEDSSIKISFNQPLNPDFCLNPIRYELSQYGNPVVVEIKENSQEVFLKFDKSIVPGNYALTLTDIRDLSGNILPRQISSFEYIKPLLYGDIVINEIFADPSPSHGMPSEEFVELFNTTTDTISLESFAFSDPETKAVLSSYKFPPRSYLILSSPEGCLQYQTYGKCLPLSPWPSLNNSSDSLGLISDQSQSIFEINYSDEWHDNNDKQEGGWSLEMINPYEYCKNTGNWKSSADPKGATPGKVNSIYSAIEDTLPPSITAWEVKDSVTLILNFDEAYKSPCDAADFYMPDNSLEYIRETDSKTISLSFSHPFPEGKEFSMQIQNIQDCIGNRMNRNRMVFLRPQEPEEADIIINEILFNPAPGGVDFVEIYNKSGKYIDLKNWKIESLKTDTITATKDLFPTSFVLNPYQYLVFTLSSSLLSRQYFVPYPDRIIEVKSLPSFTDQQGIVQISDDEGQAIDRFDYDENYHSPLLKDREGVSLERLSFYAPTNSKSNWYSAASSVGFATPGYENSEHFEANSSREIYIDPGTITPNGDNNKDLLYIQYKFTEPGNICNFKIFNSRGDLVRWIAKNELTGKEGFFYWDGTDEKGSLVNTGVYIVVGDILNLSGKESILKETVVVANGF